VKIGLQETIFILQKMAALGAVKICFMNIKPRFTAEIIPWQRL
jgi:hypothetical protein